MGQEGLPASDASEHCAHGQDANYLQQLLVELFFSILRCLSLLAKLDADVDQRSRQLWYSNRGQRADEESHRGKEQHLQESGILLMLENCTTRTNAQYTFV